MYGTRHNIAQDWVGANIGRRQTTGDIVVSAVIIIIIIIIRLLTFVEHKLEM